MAGYIGNKQKISGRYKVDEFTSSGGTTYTLSSAPGDKNNIQVSAGGLTQYPSAYSVSGTTLTLSGVPSGQKVVVRHMGDTIPFPSLDDNVVTSAKIASNSVTGAKIALGSDAAGDTMYYNGTDYARLAKGTASQLLTMNAGATAPEWATAAAAGFTYVDEEATTSGTSITLETFAAGTSLIHIMFNEMSQTAANNHFLVQLEDAGGVETSGYISTADRTGNNYSSSTSGFIVDQTYAASAFSGHMTLTRVNASHTWIASLNGKSSTVYTLNGGGSKTLSAELTKVVVKVDDGGTNFDAGSIRAMYM